MRESDIETFNMKVLSGRIYAEQNLIRSLSYEFASRYKWFDALESSNKTTCEYDMLEKSFDNDEEVNIRLSRITKLTEDRYSYFTEIDDGPFDLETEDSETIKLIIKAQLDIIYYCEDLVR